MAAMKPRTGDGPLEVTKEGRGIVMRVPLEGGGRLVVEMSADEATTLGEALKSAVSYLRFPAPVPITDRRRCRVLSGAACCPGPRHGARCGRDQHPCRRL